MLTQRTLKMIGWKKYANLLGSDLQDIQLKARHEDITRQISDVKANQGQLLKLVAELQTTVGLPKNMEFVVSQPADPAAGASAVHVTRSAAKDQVQGSAQTPGGERKEPETGALHDGIYVSSPLEGIFSSLQFLHPGPAGDDLNSRH